MVCVSASRWRWSPWRRAAARPGSGGWAAKDNGVSSKSADDIVAASLATTQNAARCTSRPPAWAGSRFAFDLHLVKGKGGPGRVTTNGLTFDMVRVGDKAYFKGDADFWSHFGGTAAGRLFAGK